jgi:hypothetical protein
MPPADGRNWWQQITNVTLPMISCDLHNLVLEWWACSNTLQPAGGQPGQRQLRGATMFYNLFLQTFLRTR